MKRFIIFRTDRLGDYLIHSRPIYEIKKKYKDCFITVVCSKINKKILDKVDYIDELIEFNKNDSLLSKINTFLYIFKSKYYACFVLDGKNFSYFCNCFLRSKKKYGILYQSYKKLFLNFKSYKPSKLYSFLFFDKAEYFTSRKYLIKPENLSQIYLNLFNELDLNLTIYDKYIFQNINTINSEFENLRLKLDLNDYILIHFDEKWIDIDEVKIKLSESLIKFETKIKKKIIITAYKNNFDYFQNLKNNFTYFNCADNNFNKIKISNITILDEVNIFMFERFLKYSKLNISCHAGFVAQVCGANGGKILDIINENDLNWYSCWKPMNTYHKFVFKSDKNKNKKKIDEIFNEIVQIL